MSTNENHFSHEDDLTALQLIRPSGYNFELEVPMRHFHRYAQMCEAYTADLLANLLSAQQLFIDVGAHYGFYTLLAASRYGHLEVIAFEPIQESYAVLIKNIDRNGVRQVQALQKAGSDCDGRSRIDRSSQLVEIETMTIDTLLERHMPCPTIIKMAAGGYELKILDGSKETLARFNDLNLIVEFNTRMQARMGHAPEEFLETLQKLGFDIFFVNDDQRQVWKVTHPQSWKSFLDNTNCINMYCPRRAKSLSVCMFAHSSELCGAERSLLELTKDLIQDYGTICTVVLPSSGPLEAELKRVGASCIVVPYSLWCTVSQTVREETTTRVGMSAMAVLGDALRIVERINPDVVMTMTMVIPWGALVASLLKKPHVWHVCEFGDVAYGLHFQLPLREILEIIRTSSSFIFTITEYHRRVLFPMLGDQDCLPLYRHIDIPPETDHRPPHHYFTRPGAVRLAIFGTIQEGKGQEDAVRALAKLVRRGFNIELLMAGHLGDPAYRARLDRFIEEQKLQDYVRIPGFISDVYTAMREADIVLVCSRQEAFGRVAVEALLLGKAVVYSASGSLPEFMRDGINGLAYCPGNIHQLVSQIERLLLRPETARTLGEKGRSYARERFTRKAFVDRAHQVLSRLRDEKPALDGSRERLLPLIVNVLQRYNTQLQEQNLELHARCNELQERHTELQAHANQLQVWNQEIVAERNELQERHTELQAHANQLQVWNQEMHGHCNELQEQIKLNEREWQSLRAGLGWKMLAGYWRCTELLVPLGTRRRRIYQKMISILK